MASTDLARNGSHPYYRHAPNTLHHLHAYHGCATNEQEPETATGQATENTIERTSDYDRLGMANKGPLSEAETVCDFFFFSH